MRKFFKILPEGRIWDWLSALLLVCALLTAATRLVATGWTDQLDIVRTLTFLGAVLGLLLGISRFPPRISFIMALLYGVVAVPWQMGLSLHMDIEWKARMQVLMERISSILDVLARSKPVEDNTLFVLLMGCLFWLLSAYAGFCLARYGGIWKAALPTGLVMMVIQAYDPFIPRRTWYLAAYLFFVLVLLSRYHFVLKQRDWKKNRTLVSIELGLDWIRYALIVAVIIVALTWVMPVVAKTFDPAQNVLNRLRRPWLEFQESLSNAFASLRSSGGFSDNFYDDTLTLGRGNALSNDLVFTVAVPAHNLPGVRYYWRAYIYDRYEDGKWVSTLTEKRKVNPENANLVFPEWAGRLEASFTFNINRSAETLYAPSQPLWVSKPVTAIMGSSPDGTADVAAFQVDDPLNRGEQYQARASLAVATTTDLREAGIEYPQWVRDNYLQVPSSITPRIRKLAQNTTAGLDNPYDMATAITLYLRNIDYSDVIDVPPANQEVLDWWLFEYRKGFCQYYATAEVILLRTLGIPARLAVGFAQGEFEANSVFTGLEGGSSPDPADFLYGGGTFHVAQRDSHAWPEVYFPGIGWVEFEPTASQLPISRLAEDNTIDPLLNLQERLLGGEPSSPDRELLNSGEAANDSLSPASPMSRVIWVGGLGLLILILVFTGIYLRRRKVVSQLPPLPVRLERNIRRLGVRPPDLLRQWAHYASMSPLAHAYLEINRALKRLGRPPEVHHTPAERASALAHLLPEASVPTDVLLTEYQLSTYSLLPGDAITAQEAGKEIRRLSLRAWIRGMLPAL